MTIPDSQYQYSIRLFRKSHTLSLQNMLLAIGAVAILLRLASAFLQGNSVTELPGILIRFLMIALQAASPMDMGFHLPKIIGQ